MKDFKDPYFSVITVVKNGCDTLQRCILSISQNKSSLPSGFVEYIVIDGGSTDCSVTIIEKYDESVIDTYISESDSGVSEAFNKGLRIAKGEWILYVNADDWLTDKSLYSAFQYIKNLNANNSITFLTGGVNLIENGKFITESYSRPANIRQESSIHHAATIIRKEDIKNEIWFKEKYKFAMDYEFFLRLIHFKKYKIVKIPLILTNRSLAGLSYTNHELALKETFEIRSEYFNKFDLYIWFYFARIKDKIGRNLKKNKYLLKIYRKIWKHWNK